MRKFLISVTVVLFAFQALHAQTEKGSENLGVNIGFNYSKASALSINPANQASTTLDAKITGFNIGPNFSYFIADKLDVGINFSYSISNTTNTTENLSTTNNNYPIKDQVYDFGGNIFIRKYCMYKDKIGIRTGGYIGYTQGNSTTNYSQSFAVYDYKSTSNYYFGGLIMDIVYYPSKKVGIAATLANLQYEHYNIDRTTQGHESGDLVNFNFINNNLSLSIFYVFSK